MNDNKCLITGLDIVKHWNISYLDVLKSCPIKSYGIKINEKYFDMSTLNMCEDFISNENICYLELLDEHRPKIIRMIYNNDEKIRGIFSWNGYKNFLNLIKLESMLDDFQEVENSSSF